MGPTGCYFRPLCHQASLLVAHWQQYYSAGWPAHTLCCSHQGFHKKPGARASHNAARVNYYVWMAILITKARAYICSYHLCWLLCTHVDWSFIFCAYNLLDLKRLKVLTLLKQFWISDVSGRPVVFNTAPGDSLPCRV